MLWRGRMLRRLLRQPPRAALASRCFASSYEGDVGNVLRFECSFPAATTLRPCDFRGRVVLVANTASQCASAAQLAALQRLYETYHARGLDVVAVPSNDFESREPGSDAEIAMVYTSPEGKFKVSFPIAKKSVVVGDAAHEFFDRVAKKYGRSTAPTWNFDKFLVDAYGDLCAVFPHDTDPLVPEVIEAIEDALAEMPTAHDSDDDADDDDVDVDDDCNEEEGEDDDDEGEDSDGDEEGEAEKHERGR